MLRTHLSSTWACRSADYVALVVDVWVFMVLPTVFALTKSILPISQGEPPLADCHASPLDLAASHRHCSRSCCQCPLSVSLLHAHAYKG